MSSRQPFDLVAAARRSMTERGFTPDNLPQVLEELTALQAHPPMTNPAAEEGIAFHVLARKTFDSSHLSVVQRIGSSLSTSLS